MDVINVCLLCKCLYVQESPWDPTGSPTLDVGTFGMMVGGGCWQVATSVFGVVIVVVVLVAAWRGGGGVRRAHEHHSTQQAENGAHPSGVEGEAERHEAELLVGTNREPDGWHQSAQC